MLYADAAVRGLVINRCLQDGLAIGSDGVTPNVTITGTYTGTNAAGTVALPNGGEDEKFFEPKLENSAIPRIIRVVSAQASPGSQVLISVEVDANGDENAFGFSLNYDPVKLSNPLVTAGSGAANTTLIPNTGVTGKVGIVLAFPTGQSIQSGTRQLVTIRFDVAPNASGGQSDLTFGNQPVVREVVDVNADVLATTFNDGFVNIFGPTAAGVTVGGRVVDAGGIPISRTTISITGTNGVTRTALSNPFGYYRLTDVSAGETYIIRVVSKQYHFTPETRVQIITDEITDLDFTADN